LSHCQQETWQSRCAPPSPPPLPIIIEASPAPDPGNTAPPSMMDPPAAGAPPPQQLPVVPAPPPPCEMGCGDGTVLDAVTGRCEISCVDRRQLEVSAGSSLSATVPSSDSLAALLEGGGETLGDAMLLAAHVLQDPALASKLGPERRQLLANSLFRQPALVTGERVSAASHRPSNH